MKFVSREQLVDALRQLAAFRKISKTQGIAHVLGFLALRRKKVGTVHYTVYAEKDDEEFFDEFTRVADDENPYFDPIKGFLRIRIAPAYECVDGQEENVRSPMACRVTPERRRGQ